jgi:prevent-host-death family protein
MKRVKITDATGSLAEYTRDLQGPLIVTAHGKPVAALVPVEGVDLETLYVGTSPVFLDVIERSRRRHETEGGLSLEQVRKRLGTPLPGRNRPADRKKARERVRKRVGQA